MPYILIPSLVTDALKHLLQRQPSLQQQHAGKGFAKHTDMSPCTDIQGGFFMDRDGKHFDFTVISAGTGL